MYRVIFYQIKQLAQFSNVLNKPGPSHQPSSHWMAVLGGRGLGSALPSTSLHGSHQGALPRNILSSPCLFPPDSFRTISLKFTLF